MVNLAALKIGSFRCRSKAILTHLAHDGKTNRVDNSPTVQVVLVGFVCFCSVGMFSAIG
jgi:hypothetical protein